MSSEDRVLFMLCWIVAFIALGLALAGCQTSDDMTPPVHLLTGNGDQAQALADLSTIKPPPANRYAIAIALLPESERVVLFQNRLRGLAVEIKEIRRRSADSWTVTTEAGKWELKIFANEYIQLRRSEAPAP